MGMEFGFGFPVETGFCLGCVLMYFNGVGIGYFVFA
jgi:hypothetical protein